MFLHCEMLMVAKRRSSACFLSCGGSFVLSERSRARLTGGLNCFEPPRAPCAPACLSAAVGTAFNKKKMMFYQLTCVLCIYFPPLLVCVVSYSSLYKTNELHGVYVEHINTHYKIGKNSTTTTHNGG